MAYRKSSASARRGARRSTSSSRSYGGRSGTKRRTGNSRRASTAGTIRLVIEQVASGSLPANGGIPQKAVVSKRAMF